MCLFLSNLFLSSSVSTLLLIPSWMLFSGFTEMTEKQPCFALNTKSNVERMGSYKNNSWSTKSHCLLLNSMNGPSCIFVDFCNIETVRHIIGPWHRVLMPPIANVLHEWAQRGNFAEWRRMCEYQNSPVLL